ncbi:hypothetical protein HY285_04035 [Candidatus Peregrinibacteria bacterium]|nr:hypothetical protein [Candidatus Peregrinibacteria bacterium]MBI3816685.1 hypothetical protein [Candidatus Peregrinibacteria bacterium]
MPHHATTVRLDPKLKRAVMKRAKKEGLTFTDVATFLFQSFAVGERKVEMTHYPKVYAEMIQREAREMKRLSREGKLKRFGSVKELFDSILER